MARKKLPAETTVESICQMDKRTIIPTEELRDFIADEEDGNPDATGIGGTVLLENDLSGATHRKVRVASRRSVQQRMPSPRGGRNGRKATHPLPARVPVLSPMRAIFPGILVMVVSLGPVWADEQRTFDTKTVEGWRAILRDKSGPAFRRRQAAWALGCFGPEAKATVPDLIEALHGTDREIRASFDRVE